MQPFDRFGEQRCRRDHFEFGKHRPRREPKWWHRIGGDDAVDGRVGERDISPGHEQTVSNARDHTTCTMIARRFCRTNERSAAADEIVHDDT